ncbi:MAG: CRTAC1 family protein [Rhodothermales bacterium]
MRPYRTWRWLGLTVLAMGLGCQPATQPEAPAAAGDNLFTDVTEEAGLLGFHHVTGAFGEKWFPESMGSGCGFIDYDGDGLVDILLAGGGAWPQSGIEPPQAIWLYHNLGGGRFALVTREAGLADAPGYSIGFGVGDYDNDGDQDFVMTTLTQDRMYRNDGGVFTDVTDLSGIGDHSGWSTSAAFFDADRDGLVDLYIGNYVRWSPETDLFCTHDGTIKGYCTPETYDGLPGRFYHNQGDGTFADWTERAGFGAAYGTTLGILTFDFDRNEWPDLMFANDTRPDQLFVNNGDGTFTERGAQSGVAYDEKGRARAGMGIDAGVVDSTGEVTVFVGNFSREMIGVYRYGGSGYFLDRAAASKIGRSSLLTLTFGLALLDIDLDGDLDLFAANGHVQPDIEEFADNVRYAEPAHVFMNQGNGTFEDVAAHIGGAAARPIVARGLAYADIDNDGDQDVLVVENGRGAHLWRNEANAQGYLRVRTQGGPSNRGGLGVRIVAVAGSRRMERYIRSGSSYLTASEQVATFGLGGAGTEVDSLYLYWPSGHVDRHAGVPAGRQWLAVEGAASLEPDRAPSSSKTSPSP